MASAAVVCTVCHNQKFKSEIALKQHTRDSAQHRARLQQQRVCAVCGGKVFKDLAAYNGHVRDSKEHRARVAQTKSQGSASPLPAGPSRTVSDASRPGSVFLSSRAETPRAVDTSSSFVDAVARSSRVPSTAGSPFTPPVVIESPVSPPVTVRCPVCMTFHLNEYMRKGIARQHMFATHPEVCCYTCGLSFSSPEDVVAHYKEHDAHPSCPHCEDAFRDSVALQFHIAETHKPPTHSHGSLYDVATAHIRTPQPASAASPLSTFDGSYIRSPLSSCDVSEDRGAVPIHSSTPIKTRASSESPRADMPKLQRALATEHVDTSPEFVRAASEPLISAAPLSDVPDHISPVGGGNLATDAWVQEQSIISQAESMLAAANSIPPNRTVSPIAEHPPAKPNNSSTTSAWSILSSPRSTRYHSPERPASPEPAPASHEQAHAVSTHATGGTFASESSSGVATPASARSLLFSLTEQLAAHRESRAGATAEPAPASASPSPSSTGSLAVSARSVLLDAPLRAEPGAGPRPTASHVRPASRVVARSRSTTPRNAHRDAYTPCARPDAAPVSGRTEPSPTAAADSPQVAAGASKDVRWHCRLCMRPTQDPTVTMCGHLFCHSCIVAEISKNLQCPVCKRMMLVRLDVCS
ncbi:hypothetical protein PHLGIDRAFT_122465 [Phlebiopsis gigantea 11061_1 CR5-6]|uniref:RING-type domain-containing protein n=1 Tax=Phlebiopsis gigantea (strain 11061_1 CR5-6) TaxID=745531 RepID=A0A0C3ND35_PHLG1|nr:hypothetical protein PHLGIDRAFT_122465 [Phlebiopsis gigantea 11061_1 CR5-6]